MTDAGKLTPAAAAVVPDIDAAEAAIRLAQMGLPLAGMPNATLRDKLEVQRRAEIRKCLADALRALGRHIDQKERP